MRYAILTIWLALMAAHANPIPTNRLGDWRLGVTVGVPGGITVRSVGAGATLVDLTSAIDTNGVVSASTTINNAITAAASNTIIFLPAGDIRCNGAIFAIKSGITLRGAGQDLTRLKPFGVGIQLGANPDFNWAFPPVASNRVATFTAGTTNLSLLNFTANSTWLNKLIQISQTNDYNTTGFGPVFHVYGFEYSRTHKAVVTAVSGTNITIWPPSEMDWTNAPVVAIASATYRANSIEDMTIVCTNSGTGAAIQLLQNVGSWVQDVKISRSAGLVNWTVDSLMCEQNRVWIDRSNLEGNPGPNHAGFLVGGCRGILIRDSIGVEVFPNWEINSSTGCAFVYNFSTQSFAGGSMNGNHGPVCAFNLYEGNVALNYQNDGNTGSGITDTLHRNWFNCIYQSSFPSTDFFDQADTGLTAIKINRFGYGVNAMGNVIGNSYRTTNYYGWLSLGKPNIGNEGWDGSYGPPWDETFIRYIGARDGGNVGYSTTAVFVTNMNPIVFVPQVTPRWYLMDMDTNMNRGLLAGGITNVVSSTQVQLLTTYANVTNRNMKVSNLVGWQEIDTNVNVRALFYANHYFPAPFPTADPSNTDTNYANPVGSFDQPLGTNTIPVSLLYAAQPAYLASYPWPPINYTNPPSGNLTNNIMIPAQARFYAVSTNLPAVIQVEPQDDTITEGDTATLSVVASGTPTINYQWYQGTHPSTTTPVGANNSSYTTPALFTTTAYWVRVSNAFGSDDSTTATITVLPPSIPPTITLEPLSGTLVSGESTNLVVAATGTAPLTYQWYIGLTGDTSSPIGGATSTTYNTGALTETTRFWVRVSNAHGFDNSTTATLTVEPDDTAPVIIVQPASQAIAEGTPVTLFVNAVGSPTLTYQWFHGFPPDESEPIGGATHEAYTSGPLFVPTFYWVQVRNDFGSANSDPVTVTTVDVSAIPGVHIEGTVRVQGRVRLQ